MVISEYTKKTLTLDDDERKAAEKITNIVQKFVEQDLCDNINCYGCPLIMFCPFSNADGFEETLNNIANME